MGNQVEQISGSGDFNNPDKKPPTKPGGGGTGDGSIPKGATKGKVYGTILTA